MLQGIIRRVFTGELLHIPGLNSIRDFLDSRDICKALIKLSLLPQDIFDSQCVVNICSGTETSIRDVLIITLQQVKQASWKELVPMICEDVEALDSHSRIVGSNAVLERLIGSPIQNISMATTIRDALYIERNK